jgi:RecG-like helicase
VTNLIEKWFSKFIVSSDELDAIELRTSIEEKGADAIADVELGKVTTHTGKIRSIVFRPEKAVPALEAEVFDGTGFIVVIWLGRRRILGIKPGISISVTGRLVEVEDRLTMYNPKYSIIAKGGEV